MDEYEVANLETKPSAPLMDDGTGTPMIIRWWDIQIPAFVKDEEMVSQDELIMGNKNNILASAWADGLSLIGDLRCVEAEPRHYRIGGLFKARPNAVILEDPKLIQHASS